MSLQPDLPFEFVVMGTAISAQGSSHSREEWKETIRRAANQALPEGCWALQVPLAITIYIFPGTKMQGDLDNRVKPILDAMNRRVYRDDELVERIVVQKFELGGEFPFEDPTDVLRSALEAEDPVVYIRITDDLVEELP